MSVQLEKDIGIKFCISSILHRPDSQKASISPDASLLRKLVRDRNCRPVLRGILESLLHYLTKDLPNLTTRNRDPEKQVLGIVAERNIRNRNWPAQRAESSRKQTQLQTNGNGTMTKGNAGEIRSKIPEKCRSDQQKQILPSGCGEDQRAGDLISRRLTSFKLLQSKFTRSTPKPPITHQREVGTLSSSRGVAGNVNHCQDSEPDMRKRGQARREHVMKRGNNVKDIVAKFAIAEQKERGENMLPVKPRLTGKGILLSSLMEKFETMATDFTDTQAAMEKNKATNRSRSVGGRAKDRVDRTFPDNVQFRKTSNPCLQKALYNVLLAYGHHNPAVGYCQTVLRIWDCLFYEGSKILFRVALTLIHHNQALIQQAQSLPDVCQTFKQITHGPFVDECHTFMQKIFTEPGSLSISTLTKLRATCRSRIIAEES
eukprot:superscaffoldBa00002263_g13711